MTPNFGLPLSDNQHFDEAWKLLREYYGEKEFCGKWMMDVGAPIKLKSRSEKKRVVEWSRFMAAIVEVVALAERRDNTPNSQPLMHRQQDYSGNPILFIREVEIDK